MSTFVESEPQTAECPHCHIPVIGPEWSETVDGKTVRVWLCPLCDKAFETTESVVEQELPEKELVEEFLPNLMVG